MWDFSVQTILKLEHSKPNTITADKEMGKCTNLKREGGMIPRIKETDR